jgi:hypothetical protein
MTGRALLILFLAVLLCAAPLLAAGDATIKARVLDVAGRPVAGAKLFVYDSTDTRRPADFISRMSDREGWISLPVPPGRYWAVARLKRDAGYGPLQAGDRHSGEPAPLEVSAGEELAAEFLVADIRDVGRKRQSVAAESIRVSGRIVDTHGAPVVQAYVFANRSKAGRAVPEFLSAWSGADGSYTLYLPARGSYFLGVTSQFPLGAAGRLREFVPEAGGMDVVMDFVLAAQ